MAEFLKNANDVVQIAKKDALDEAAMSAWLHGVATVILDADGHQLKS